MDPREGRVDLVHDREYSKTTSGLILFKKLLAYCELGEIDRIAVGEIALYPHVRRRTEIDTQRNQVRWNINIWWYDLVLCYECALQTLVQIKLRSLIR